MCINCLTGDERALAVELIDQIIEKRRRLPYEEAWLSFVWEEWIVAQKAGLAKARAYIEAVQTTMTHDEIGVVISILRDHIGPEIATPMRTELLDLFEKSYGAGKMIVTEAMPSIDISFGLVDKTAVNWLTDHHLYWIGNYYDKNLSGAIANTVAEGMAQGLGRKEIGKMLGNFFEDYPGVPMKPANYWQGLAANAMSRSRNFGAIGGFDEAGFKDFEIFSAGDEKVCDVCSEMDGKEFSVASAMGQRQQLMNCSDPETVKMVAPWPSIDQITNRSSMELQAAGIGMPPYHWSCRCGIIAA
ncbi:phage head morphogenesis protein [Candidatus Pacearchaeota archaeon]|jgi:hypothetical protein|nr:phage head morphogenesis protein [Candidatus Pacearchaeota archaeon]